MRRTIKHLINRVSLYDTIFKVDGNFCTAKAYDGRIFFTDTTDTEVLDVPQDSIRYVDGSTFAYISLEEHRDIYIVAYLAVGLVKDLLGLDGYDEEE
jgi:hypothetical protein